MSSKKQPRKPLHLEVSASEGVLLLVGVQLVNELIESIHIQDQEMGEHSIEALIRKLEQVLGDDFSLMADEIVEELINSFLPEVQISELKLPAFNYPMYSVEDKLPVIERAIEKKRVLNIEYYSMAKEDIYNYELEPYALGQREDYQILIAYCRQREDIRVFRVDRIKSVQMNTEEFQFPAGFKPEAYSDEEAM